MSYPPPHNRAHEYKYSCPKIQKTHPFARSASALPVRLGPLRRFAHGAGPPRLAPHPPNPATVHTLFTLVHNKKSFQKIPERPSDLTSARFSIPNSSN